MRRIILSAVAAVAMSLVLATSALAEECVNASKNPAAGVQVVFDINTGATVWISDGLQHRLDQGVVDPVTGAGLHGLIGLDFRPGRPGWSTPGLVDARPTLGAHAHAIFGGGGKDGHDTRSTARRRTITRY